MEGFPLGRGGGFQLWQQEQQHQIQNQQQAAQGSSPQTQHQFNYLSFSHDAASLAAAAAAAASGSSRAMRATSSSGGSGSVSCQDCGNQAKKDCTHMRCRTCCKSKGYHCPTHVKSTWVPAAKRRERQQQLAAALEASERSGGAGGGLELSKRPRDTRIVAAGGGAGTSSGAGAIATRFPTEVSSEATFRCVRLGTVDQHEPEYAYQTAVRIGGHVFKGILHDHGPDPSIPPDYHHHHHRNISEGTSPAAAATSATEAITPAAGGVVGTSAMLMDPYPTPLVFMSGSPFYPHHQNPRQ